MKVFIFICTCIGFLVSSFTACFSAGQKNYEAWLVIETGEGNLKVHACCKNNTYQSVKLLIKTIVERTGGQGTSKSSQTSLVSLEPQQWKCFHQVTINENIDDEYKIQLNVYKDGILISEDRIFKKKEK